LIYWSTKINTDINILDGLAFIVSLIALGYSIWQGSKTSQLEKKMNSKVLNSEFFKEIFFTLIIKEIPTQILEIKMANTFPDIKAKTRLLRTNLSNLRKNAEFYKYFEKEFHTQLVTITTNLEDELIKAIQTSNVESFKSREVKIDNEVNNLYNLLRNYYSELN